MSFRWRGEAGWRARSALRAASAWTRGSCRMPLLKVAVLGGTDAAIAVMRGVTAVYMIAYVDAAVG